MSRGWNAGWSGAKSLVAGALFVVYAGALGAQQPTPSAPQSEPQSGPQSTHAPAAAVPDDAPLPPEEDKALIPKEYTFNPVQSKREVVVGEFYFKKGDYKAAAGRFLEATHWNDGNAEAWLRLAESREKNHLGKEARAAYSKYLELAADAKNAPEIRKRLERLK